MKHNSLFKCRWLVALLALAIIDASVCAAESHITDVVVSPDGKQVIACSNAGLLVYDWADLKQAKKIKLQDPHPTCIQFSPDNTRIAVSGGVPNETGFIEIFSWPALAVVGVHKAHDDQIMSCIWKDNATIFSASLDHTINILDLKQKTVSSVLNGHSRGVIDLCFLKNENVLISGGLDHSLRIWNMESNQLQRTLSNHTRPIQSLAKSPTPNGLPIIASASGDRTIRIWQPTIGRLVRFVRLDSTPLDIAWLDSNRIVASCTDGFVYIIDATTVEVLRSHRAIHNWAYCIAIHPDLSELVVGGERGQLVKLSVMDLPGSSTSKKDAN